MDTTTLGGFTLKVPSYWHRIDPIDREAMANGVGAAWMPEAVRRILDRLPCLYWPSKVHDVEYSVGRSQLDKHEADRRFYENGLIVAKALYPWIKHPIKRWRAEFVVEQARKALERAGFLAFSTAHKHIVPN